MLTKFVFFFFVVLGAMLPASAEPSLRGSRASVDRMARQAKLHDFTRLTTETRVEAFVKAGLLLRLRGDANYRIDDEVSHPFVRPEVKIFVERLSRQSRATCPTGLVVTSLTRPIDEQPRNASAKSVHPTGMAIDFHVPERAKCRAWLERTLLSLEGASVLEATRERRPPHYHVAVFPKPYVSYLVKKTKVAVVKTPSTPKTKKSKAKTPTPKRAKARDKGKRKK